MCVAPSIINSTFKLWNSPCSIHWALEINSNCGGRGGRDREGVSACLANGASDAAAPLWWPSRSRRHCRRGARESGDDYPADQVDGDVVEAEEAHAETQALKRVEIDRLWR